MAPTVLTGPRHRTLETRAFQVADEVAGDAMGSVLYLARNDTRRERIEDAWAETHRPLRLRAETLDAVVRDWYERLEGPIDRPSGQVNRRLTEYALDGATAVENSVLAGESASAALADAFSGRFSLFDDAGLTTAAALEAEFDESDLDERIASATVDAYREYRRLEDESLADWIRTRGELLETVASADQPLSALTPEIDVVIVSGYHEFRPLERAVLERITDAFETVAILPLHQSGGGDVDAAATDALEVYDRLGFEREVVEPPTDAAALSTVTNAMYRPEPGEVPDPGPERLRWRELPTPEREVRFVARELRTELADGRDPDELAVVVPGLETYAGHVDDVFETFEIPHMTTAASSLDRTYIGSAVHDLLALAEPDPRAEDLTALLANPLVELVSDDRAAAVTATARRRDSVSLEPLLEAVDDETAAAIEQLLATLETLRTAELGTAVETLRTLVDDRLGLGEAVEGYAGDGNTGRALEYRALDLVTEVLESFETMREVSSPLSPLALFTRAFDGVPIRAPRPDAGGRVEVMGMLDARMRAFESVYVVGLTADQFPTAPERPAFFDRMTDAHPRLDTGDERLRGRYLFATLLANVDDVTLTTPETGADDDAVVRSPVLDELQRVTGIEPTAGVDDRIGAREDLQRHVAACRDRRAAIDHAGEIGDLTPGQTKRADRGLICAANRSSTDLTPHDGVLEASTVDDVYPTAEREPYSASRLERYVECGFRFYAETVLDIADPDDVEATPTPLETGTYVHDVLERFYADLGDTIDLAASDRDELEAHLLEVALDELGAADFEYDGLFYERWGAELLAGLGDADANPYAASSDVPHDRSERRPRDAPERGLFATFLDQELSRGGSDGGGGGDRQIRLELPFGEGLPEDATPLEVDCPDGSTVSIRGYIDRVDIDASADEPALSLYDYKTGRAPYMTQTTGGTKFQLPIYLLAADEVLRAELLESETPEDVSLSATYYQVRPPNDVKVPRGVESKFDSQAELRRFLDDVVPAWLGTIDDAVANGRFHTTLLSARAASCDYCDYRRACDVRHHRKRETIDAVTAGDSGYVPLRVRDDADLEGVMSDD